MSMPTSQPDDRGYEPGFPVPTTDFPPRMPAAGRRVGRVVGVEVRQESQYASSNASVAMTVLAFRLAEPGNPQPLDVMLRGRSLAGTVRDGDWVEIAGPPNDNGRWNVATVQNLTTGAAVTVTGGRASTAARVVVIVLLCLFLLLAALITIGIVVGMTTS